VRIDGGRGFEYADFDRRRKQQFAGGRGKNMARAGGVVVRGEGYGSVDIGWSVGGADWGRGGGLLCSGDESVASGSFERAAV
jgi:hypothetical protein